VLCSNNDYCYWEILAACGMIRQVKWFRYQLPGEGFIVGLCTVESPERNHSLARTPDVLESGGVRTYTHYYFASTRRNSNRLLYIHIYKIRCTKLPWNNSNS